MNLKEHISLPLFGAIQQASKELGYESFVVGGYVRDILLEKPSKDVDIVTIGSGIELASKVAEKYKDKMDVIYFKNFGTAMLKYEDFEVEFVGARKESYRRESRKPIVENGTLQDDQNRRDFTINSLFISLNESNFGELIDPFNGQQHLTEKLLDTPLDSDITFSDDPLRMMRGIRFASQLNFKLSERVFGSIKKNKNRITIVSQERITEELNKIILSPVPSVGFKLLFDTGLLHLIFPEMTNLQGVDYISGKGHKDNFYHTLQVLDNISVNTNNLWLRWAAILHDIAKPVTKRFDKNAGWTFHGHEDKGAKMVPKIFQSLKLPADNKMKYVQKLVMLHLRPIVLAKEEVTASAIRRLLFDAGDDIDDLMMLCDADITSKNERKVQKYLSNFQLVRRKLKEVEEKDKIRNMQPPITGEMIMQIFDLKPCKEIGMIKNAVKDAILDGEISNTELEAYDFVKKKGRELGLQLVKEIFKTK